MHRYSTPLLSASVDASLRGSKIPALPAPHVEVLGHDCMLLPNDSKSSSEATLLGSKTPVLATNGGKSGFRDGLLAQVTATPEYEESEDPRKAFDLVKQDQQLYPDDTLHKTTWRSTVDKQPPEMSARQEQQEEKKGPISRRSPDDMTLSSAQQLRMAVSEEPQEPGGSPARQLREETSRSLPPVDERTPSKKDGSEKRPRLTTETPPDASERSQSSLSKESQDFSRRKFTRATQETDRPIPETPQKKTVVNHKSRMSSIPSSVGVKAAAQDRRAPVGIPRYAEENLPQKKAVEEFPEKVLERPKKVRWVDSPRAPGQKVESSESLAEQNFSQDASIAGGQDRFYEPRRKVDEQDVLSIKRSASPVASIEEREAKMSRPEDERPAALRLNTTAVAERPATDSDDEPAFSLTLETADASPSTLRALELQRQLELPLGWVQEYDPEAEELVRGLQKTWMRWMFDIKATEAISRLENAEQEQQEDSPEAAAKYQAALKNRERVQEWSRLVEIRQSACERDQERSPPLASEEPLGQKRKIEVLQPQVPPPEATRQVKERETAVGRRNYHQAVLSQQEADLYRYPLWRRREGERDGVYQCGCNHHEGCHCVGTAGVTSANSKLATLQQLAARVREIQSPIPWAACSLEEGMTAWIRMAHHVERIGTGQVVYRAADDGLDCQMQWPLISAKGSHLPRLKEILATALTMGARLTEFTAAVREARVHLGQAMGGDDHRSEMEDTDLLDSERDSELEKEDEAPVTTAEKDPPTGGCVGVLLESQQLADRILSNEPGILVKRPQFTALQNMTIDGAATAEGRVLALKTVVAWFRELDGTHWLQQGGVREPPTGLPDLHGTFSTQISLEYLAILVEVDRLGLELRYDLVLRLATWFRIPTLIARAGSARVSHDHGFPGMEQVTVSAVPLSANTDKNTWGPEQGDWRVAQLGEDGNNVRKVERVIHPGQEGYNPQEVLILTQDGSQRLGHAFLLGRPAGGWVLSMWTVVEARWQPDMMDTSASRSADLRALWFGMMEESTAGSEPSAHRLVNTLQVMNRFRNMEWDQMGTRLEIGTFESEQSPNSIQLQRVLDTEYEPIGSSIGTLCRGILDGLEPRLEEQEELYRKAWREVDEQSYLQNHHPGGHGRPSVEELMCSSEARIRRLLTYYVQWTHRRRQPWADLFFGWDSKALEAPKHATYIEDRMQEYYSEYRMSSAFLKWAIWGREFRVQQQLEGQTVRLYKQTRQNPAKVSTASHGFTQQIFEQIVPVLRESVLGNERQRAKPEWKGLEAGIRTVYPAAAEATVEVIRDTLVRLAHEVALYDGKEGEPYELLRDARRTQRRAPDTIQVWSRRLDGYVMEFPTATRQEAVSYLVQWELANDLYVMTRTIYAEESILEERAKYLPYVARWWIAEAQGSQRVRQQEAWGETISLWSLVNKECLIGVHELESWDEVANARWSVRGPRNGQPWGIHCESPHWWQQPGPHRPPPSSGDDPRFRDFVTNPPQASDGIRIPLGMNQVPAVALLHWTSFVVFCHQNGYSPLLGYGVNHETTMWPAAMSEVIRAYIVKGEHLNDQQPSFGEIMDRLNWVSHLMHNPPQEHATTPLDHDGATFELLESLRDQAALTSGSVIYGGPYVLTQIELESAWIRMVSWETARAIERHKGCVRSYYLQLQAPGSDCIHGSGCWCYHCSQSKAAKCEQRKERVMVDAGGIIELHEAPDVRLAYWGPYMGDSVSLLTSGWLEGLARYLPELGLRGMSLLRATSYGAERACANAWRALRGLWQTGTSRALLADARERTGSPNARSRLNGNEIEVQFAGLFGEHWIQCTLEERSRESLELQEFQGAIRIDADDLLSELAPGILGAALNERQVEVLAERIRQKVQVRLFAHHEGTVLTLGAALWQQPPTSPSTLPRLGRIGRYPRPVSPLPDGMCQTARTVPVVKWCWYRRDPQYGDKATSCIRGEIDFLHVGRSGQFLVDDSIMVRVGIEGRVFPQVLTELQTRALGVEFPLQSNSACLPWIPEKEALPRCEAPLVGVRRELEDNRGDGRGFRPNSQATTLSYDSREARWVLNMSCGQDAKQHDAQFETAEFSTRSQYGEIFAWHQGNGSCPTVLLDSESLRQWRAGRESFVPQQQRMVSQEAHYQGLRDTFWESQGQLEVQRDVAVALLELAGLLARTVETPLVLEIAALFYMDAIVITAVEETRDLCFQGTKGRLTTDPRMLGEEGRVGSEVLVIIQTDCLSPTATVPYQQTPWLKTEKQKVRHCVLTTRRSLEQAGWMTRTAPSTLACLQQLVRGTECGMVCNTTSGDPVVQIRQGPIPSDSRWLVSCAGGATAAIMYQADENVEEVGEMLHQDSSRQPGPVPVRHLARAGCSAILLQEHAVEEFAREHPLELPLDVCSLPQWIAEWMVRNEERRVLSWSGDAEAQARELQEVRGGALRILWATLETSRPLMAEVLIRIAEVFGVDVCVLDEEKGRAWHTQLPRDPLCLGTPAEDEVLILHRRIEAAGQRVAACRSLFEGEGGSLTHCMLAVKEKFREAGWITDLRPRNAQFGAVSRRNLTRQRGPPNKSLQGTPQTQRTHTALCELVGGWSECGDVTGWGCDGDKLTNMPREILKRIHAYVGFEEIWFFTLGTMGAFWTDHGQRIAALRQLLLEAVDMAGAIRGSCISPRARVEEGALQRQLTQGVPLYEVRPLGVYVDHQLAELVGRWPPLMAEGLPDYVRGALQQGESDFQIFLQNTRNLVSECQEYPLVRVPKILQLLTQLRCSPQVPYGCEMQPDTLVMLVQSEGVQELRQILHVAAAAQVQLAYFCELARLQDAVAPIANTSKVLRQIEGYLTPLEERRPLPPVGYHYHPGSAMVVPLASSQGQTVLRIRIGDRWKRPLQRTINQWLCVQQWSAGYPGKQQLLPGRRELSSSEVWAELRDLVFAPPTASRFGSQEIPQWLMICEYAQRGFWEDCDRIAAWHDIYIPLSTVSMALQTGEALPATMNQTRDGWYHHACDLYIERLREKMLRILVHRWVRQMQRDKKPLRFLYTDIRPSQVQHGLLKSTEENLPFLFSAINREQRGPVLAERRSTEVRGGLVFVLPNKTRKIQVYVEMRDSRTCRDVIGEKMVTPEQRPFLLTAEPERLPAEGQGPTGPWSPDPWQVRTPYTDTAAPRQLAVRHRVGGGCSAILLDCVRIRVYTELFQPMQRLYEAERDKPWEELVEEFWASSKRAVRQQKGFELLQKSRLRRAEGEQAFCTELLTEIATCFGIGTVVVQQGEEKEQRIFGTQGTTVAPRCYETATLKLWDRLETLMTYRRYGSPDDFKHKVRTEAVVILQGLPGELAHCVLAPEALLLAVDSSGLIYNATRSEIQRVVRDWAPCGMMTALGQNSELQLEQLERAVSTLPEQVQVEVQELRDLLAGEEATSAWWLRQGILSLFLDNPRAHLALARMGMAGCCFGVSSSTEMSMWTQDGQVLTARYTRWNNKSQDARPNGKNQRRPVIGGDTSFTAILKTAADHTALTANNKDRRSLEVRKLWPEEAEDDYYVILHPLELLAEMYSFVISLEMASGAGTIFGSLAVVARQKHTESWKEQRLQWYEELELCALVWHDTTLKYGELRLGTYSCPVTEDENAGLDSDVGSNDTVLLSDPSDSDLEQTHDELLKAAVKRSEDDVLVAEQRARAEALEMETVFAYSLASEKACEVGTAGLALGVEEQQTAEAVAQSKEEEIAKVQRRQRVLELALIQQLGVLEVAADGNCIPRALAKLLWNVEERHPEVRSQLCIGLMEGIRDQEPWALESGITYAEARLQVADGCFLQLAHLRAAANQYRYAIRVFNAGEDPDNPNEPVLRQILPAGLQEGELQGTLSVIFDGINHYYGARPLAATPPVTPPDIQVTGESTPVTVRSSPRAVEVNPQRQTPDRLPLVSGTATPPPPELGQRGGMATGKKTSPGSIMRTSPALEPRLTTIEEDREANGPESKGKRKKKKGSSPQTPPTNGAREEKLVGGPPGALESPEKISIGSPSRQPTPIGTMKGWSASQVLPAEEPTPEEMWPIVGADGTRPRDDEETALLRDRVAFLKEKLTRKCGRCEQLEEEATKQQAIVKYQQECFLQGQQGQLQVAREETQKAIQQYEELCVTTKQTQATVERQVQQYNQQVTGLEQKVVEVQSAREAADSLVAQYEEQILEAKVLAAKEAKEGQTGINPSEALERAKTEGREQRDQIRGLVDRVTELQGQNAELEEQAEQASQEGGSLQVLDAVREVRVLAAATIEQQGPSLGITGGWYQITERLLNLSGHTTCTTKLQEQFQRAAAFGSEMPPKTSVKKGKAGVKLDQLSNARLKQQLQELEKLQNELWGEARAPLWDEIRKHLAQTVTDRKARRDGYELVSKLQDTDARRTLLLERLILAAAIDKPQKTVVDSELEEEKTREIAALRIQCGALRRDTQRRVAATVEEVESKGWLQGQAEAREKREMKREMVALHTEAEGYREDQEQLESLRKEHKTLQGQNTTQTRELEKALEGVEYLSRQCQKLVTENQLAHTQTQDREVRQAKEEAKKQEEEWQELRERAQLVAKLQLAEKQAAEIAAANIATLQQEKIAMEGVRDQLREAGKKGELQQQEQCLREQEHLKLRRTAEQQAAQAASEITRVKTECQKMVRHWQEQAETQEAVLHQVKSELEVSRAALVTSSKHGRQSRAGKNPTGSPPPGLTPPSRNENGGHPGPLHSQELGGPPRPGRRARSRRRGGHGLDQQWLLCEEFDARGDVTYVLEAWVGGEDVHQELVAVHVDDDLAINTVKWYAREAYDMGHALWVVPTEVVLTYVPDRTLVELTEFVEAARTMVAGLATTPWKALLEGDDDSSSEDGFLEEEYMYDELRIGETLAVPMPHGPVQSGVIRSLRAGLLLVQMPSGWEELQPSGHRLLAFRAGDLAPETVSTVTQPNGGAQQPSGPRSNTPWTSPQNQHPFMGGKGHGNTSAGAPPRNPGASGSAGSALTNMSTLTKVESRMMEFLIREAGKSKCNVKPEWSRKQFRDDKEVINRVARLRALVKTKFDGTTIQEYSAEARAHVLWKLLEVNDNAAQAVRPWFVVNERNEAVTVARVPRNNLGELDLDRWLDAWFQELTGINYATYGRVLQMASFDLSEEWRFGDAETRVGSWVDCVRNGPMQRTWLEAQAEVRNLLEATTFQAVLTERVMARAEALFQRGVDSGTTWWAEIEKMVVSGLEGESGVMQEWHAYKKDPANYRATGVLQKAFEQVPWLGRPPEKRGAGYRYEPRKNTTPGWTPGLGRVNAMGSQEEIQYATAEEAAKVATEPCQHHIEMAMRNPKNTASREELKSRMHPTCACLHRGNIYLRSTLVEGGLDAILARHSMPAGPEKEQRWKDQLAEVQQKLQGYRQEQRMHLITDEIQEVGDGMFDYVTEGRVNTFEGSGPPYV